MEECAQHPRLLLWGCGKMGWAMLSGWLKAGWPQSHIEVIDPYPSDLVLGCGVAVNPDAPQTPDYIVMAVKPQMMGDVLPHLAAFPVHSAILSIAAGIEIAQFAVHRPKSAPIIRAMPNTPAEIGQGITGYYANNATTPVQKATVEELLSALGQSLEVAQEGDIDIVTGVSGSGPAYVFYFIEALSAAGVEEGLEPETARRLAIATVSGAGALAAQSPLAAEQLRINVTSPKGTTEAGLRELMHAGTGLSPVVRRTVAAATARSRELGKKS